MKDERNVRHRRTAGGNWRPVAIILAAVLMVLSVPLGGKAVLAADPTGPVDVNAECSLKVNIGTTLPEEDKADLAEAKVVVDLYRVADAVEVVGYDTYSWSVNEPYKTALEEAGVQITDKIDKDTWRKVADIAAKQAIGEVPEGTDTMEPKPAAGVTIAATGNVNEKISGLKAGLYLIIPHGNNEAYGTGKEYVSTRTDDAGVKKQVTLANSAKFTYSFSSELVSLPNKGPDENGVINTANVGPWQYDADVDLTLKFGKEVRVGDLRIIKNLVNYRVHTITGLDGVTREVYDESTFVFKVTAYKNKAAYEEMGEDAPKVYNDYVSMMFTGAKESSVLIKDLPVDAYVIVKEEYSGKTYEPVEGDSDTKDTIIIANDTVEVRFANKYDDRHGGGGSVTNKFTYHEGMSDWGWERVTDSSESGTVIPPKPKN